MIAFNTQHQVRPAAIASILFDPSALDSRRIQLAQKAPRQNDALPSDEDKKVLAAANPAEQAFLAPLEHSHVFELITVRRLRLVIKNSSR